MQEPYEFTPGKQCIMNDVISEEYKKAEKVIPYRDFVKTTFAYNSSINMGTISGILDLLHVTIGIAGEHIEFKNEINHHIYLKELFEDEEDISPTSQQELQHHILLQRKNLVIFATISIWQQISSIFHFLMLIIFSIIRMRGQSKTLLMQ